MRGIKITPALNGWKVKVGCGEVVFEDKNFMLKELGRYIDNPAEVEKAYQDSAVNKGLVGLAEAAEAPLAATCSSEDAADNPDRPIGAR